MDTVRTFLAHAVVLENDAAERYDELADAMETHNNPEVCELFRRMAGYSRLHLQEATEHAEKHAGGLPDLKPWEFQWPGEESPESGELDQSHYLMTVHHALKLALAAETGARDFYGQVARSTRNDEVRALAEEFTAEEAEHAELIEEWLKRYPAPEEGWDEDPDPPAPAD
ncbi:ferritin-like domain-containing protein [Alkalilimnicola ehrlichii]|nr:ferritin family protein [Alkalilimnicola ehrlichii]